MRHRALILAVALSITAASSRASADGAQPTKADVDEAGRHFKRGVDLFRDSDFGGALAEFRRAQQLAPNFRVLYNMGQALFELKKYAEALKMFEDYLAQGGAQVPKDRRAEVEADLDKLRARVATLAVDVNVEGAEISVDGEVVGKSPLSAPLLVSAGRLTVTVSAPDRVPVNRVVEIAGGDQSKLAIELVSTAAAAATVAAAPPPEAPPAAVPVSAPPPQDRGPVVAMWVGWATTGALVVAAAATGGLALGAKSDLDSALKQTPGDPNAISDAKSRGRTLAGVSTGLTVAAVVGAGISTYFTVQVLQAKPSSREAASLRVGVFPGGVSAVGAF